MVKGYKSDYNSYKILYSTTCTIHTRATLKTAIATSLSFRHDLLIEQY